MYTFTSVYFFETICELKNGLTSTEGHAVVQLVEAPRYKPGVRVRLPMVSLEFFIDINLTASLWPWG